MLHSSNGSRFFKMPLHLASSHWIRRDPTGTNMGETHMHARHLYHRLRPPQARAPPLARAHSRWSTAYLNPSIVARTRPLPPQPASDAAHTHARGPMTEFEVAPARWFLRSSVPQLRSEVGLNQREHNSNEHY
jgi:hypothetical protein